MMKKNKEIKRLNLYLAGELFNKIKQESQKDFLPMATWLKQYLNKNLLENNMKFNPLKQDEI